MFTDRKKIAKTAWESRENGDCYGAIELLNHNLESYTREKRWIDVINTLIDLSINHRILGQYEKDPTHLKKAVEELLLIKELADKHDLPLRPDWYFHKWDYCKSIKRNTKQQFPFLKNT